MTRNHWMTVAAALSLAALGGCAKGEQAGQPADSTARNLTLAPAESTAAMEETTEPTPQPRPAPAERAPAPKPKPAAPAMRTLAAGTHFELAVSDTITSRTAKAGDPFTATVVEDVKDAQGRVVIPAGSVANGTITEVKPAPNPRAMGTLTVAVSTLTVRGTDYPLSVSIDSIETVHKGRGVEGADAARVGAGAAAGAIAGRLLGKNKKGTIIGGLVGAAAGAAVSAGVKDVDIVVPSGAHLVITLTKPLSVKAS